MGKRRKDLPLIEGLHITTLAAEGKAMGKVDNQVVFVPMTVPGDVVDVQIRKHHRRYMEGTVVRFIERSPLRTEPFCDHFGVCGGCKWQNLPYDEQLKQKTKQVEDQLVRIGHLDIPEVRPCLGSARTREYRNKLEFTFADRRWLTYEEIAAGGDIEPMPAVGFHIPGCFDKVLHIENCYLQDEISNRIRIATHKYCMENNISYFDLRSQVGMMRTLMIRNSVTTGELMVIVVFAERDEAVWNGLLEHLATNFPEITSLLYICNQKANDTIGDQEVMVYKGKDFFYETMEDLKFKVGPKSFYQTNTLQAYELYKVAREFAGLTGNEMVYDLYTGTGTIANFVAKKAKKVVGIEYVPEAIEDAKVNAELNGLDNLLFYAGDMKNILTDDFIAEHGKPDVIITDPPRAGMHEDVIKVILNAAPEKIVYVSCNPATQARDLAMMSEQYKIVAVQPVDMFPHTHHVENVVLLIRK